MQRATGLIAAGALSLSLTPGIALAENDKGSEQQPVAEQQANSPAAGEDTAAATDNVSAENGTAGEGGSVRAATPQTAPEAAPLATPVAQSSTENLAQTGDATLPFGLAVTGIALAAGAVALISRRLLKH